MVIYVDIDETICDTPESRDYNVAIPKKDRIEIINRLYDEGHTIVYWTARGCKSGVDWTNVTVRQLKEWGAKSHDVVLGKPYYDLFIDDKALNSDFYFGDCTD